MTMVTCTKTFIDTSRAIHGDKYDYSQTIYVGANKPIVIVCYNCGPFTLAHAQTHYSKQQCGCRYCNRKEELVLRGRLRTCVSCGEWARYRTIMGMCESCLLAKTGKQRLAWEYWAKCTLNRSMKYQRRRAVNNQTVWNAWAIRKYCNLLGNYRRRDVLRAKERKSSWRDWITLQVKGKLRKGESKWQKKCRAWATTLRLRGLKGKT